MVKVKLLYYTPDYHKLVEMAARECYQSYHKVSEDSHSFIRGIMDKGHISIASVGNIVFLVEDIEQDLPGIAIDLLTMKEINNYIRWTKRYSDVLSSFPNVFIISMDVLTLMDIHKNIVYYRTYSQLWDRMENIVAQIPEINWFLDRSVELPHSPNRYTKLGEPELYKPVILTEDYTSLKKQGLTDYELDIHATVTVNIKVDRSAGYQKWRHSDMTGGTELSQRFVDRSNAEFRRMVGFEVGKYPDGIEEYAKKNNMSIQAAKNLYDELVMDLYDFTETAIDKYANYKQILMEMGVRKKRANEIARSILPNSMTTKIIQCRPLRQWKHLFNLRDSVHAQKEIQEDVRAIKAAFLDKGIEI